MKTVVSNSMVAHLWANQSQEHARSGSMSFQGPRAYSYRAHVASIVRTARGAIAALITSDKYSVTTARHCAEYAHAARHHVVYYVPDVSGTADGHVVNLAYLEKRYTDERAALHRCPADSWRLADGRPLDKLAVLAGACADYANAFGVKREAGSIFNASGDVAAIIARRNRLLNDPKREAKRAAAAAARERAEARKREAAEAARLVRLQECAAAIAEWRTGANVHLPWNARTNERGSAMLRVKDDRVETSQGAHAPLDHVRRVLRFWQRVVGAGQTVTAGHNEARADITLGSFRLDSIDSAGNVRAGCHYIERAEVDALAAVVLA